MKWKNGKGESSQIAIFPSSSVFSKSEFLWRLSSAKISAPNSFSIFEDHDRILTVLGDGALELKVEGEEEKILITPHSIFQFAGRDKISCEIKGQEVTDLGIIYNRRWFDASMKVETAGEISRHIRLTEGTHFFICAGPDIFVNDERLQYLDSAETSSSDVVSIRGSRSDCKFVWIQVKSRVE